jgi:PRTRC genetic system protein C
MTRVFEHNGKRLGDPDPNASAEDAVSMLSAKDSELTNAKLSGPSERMGSDGPEQVYNLKTSYGHKG